MLASLLPGLRELRTPLAVGYLWILNIWLIFGDMLPRQAPEGWAAVRRVYELSDILGRAVTVAAVSFAAYIIGSMLVWPFPATQRFVTMYTLGGRPGWRVVFGIGWFSDPNRSDHAIYRALNFIIRAFNSVMTSILTFILGSAVTSFTQTARELTAKAGRRENEILNVVAGNRHDLRTRLLIADKELFGEYDRLVAESNFRINITPPLVVMMMTLLFTLKGDNVLLGFALAALIPLTGFLYLQGAARDYEALTVLMRAIVVEKITAPYLMNGEEENVGDRFM